MMIIDMINFLEYLLLCLIQSINKKILLYLNTKLYNQNQSVDKEILNYLDELYKMQRNVIDESISLGDVISWMKLYEDIVILHDEKIFIELLKAVYSIRKNIINGDRDMFNLYFMTNYLRQKYKQ